MSTSLPAKLTVALPATVATAIVWAKTSVFGADGQFDGVAIADASITPGASITDLTAALAAVERSLLPCANGDVVIEALGAMYATRRSRPGQQIDEEASLQILAERVHGFPRDVLVEVGNHFIDSTPWMPAVSEFLQIAERKMRPRRALKKAIEEAIARASAPTRVALPAPSRPATQRERLATAVVLRRQAGDDRTAARFELQLAKLEGREPSGWATDAVAAQVAEHLAKAAEYQRLADEEAAKAGPSPRSETQRTLDEMAQQRRDAMLGGERGSEAA
ncbi:hypothetical protein [Reyranella sp.]|jgi:hypothetical protein|uniref:hypothetical protein n=1 Tax=Reyranella sp. TaxID=1929291 RepID=UPI000BCFFD8F|nr:hypothetical protein [Reyranella sp.]OYY35572.1 MAG: hypothetical protein B7Y57_25675 [Rhodospirillales bacterium 35-66-84]OYZ91442.1 MAG: hypothetical protein B7Y08_25545 [Rhodospirillales bacterium 24-66-33]OZB21979.1 MAG: hypothetical protein B7X63_24470 [Rhodospirillales bacterium 39-66-50]HQS15007.1 hypothetical protein [Reyranella sp.]HQT10816.1 hypothetical protein [Reyranella sp.]